MGRLPIAPSSILVLLFAGIASTASAFEVAKLTYRNIPSSRLDLTGAEEDEIDITAEEYRFQARVPVLLSGERTVLVNSISARALRQTYSGGRTGDGVFRPDYLFAFRYGLGLRQRLSGGKALWIFVQPSLLTDFDEVDRDALSLRLIGMYEREVSETFAWGLGVAYLDNFGESKVIPIGSLEWWVNRSWQIELELPRSFESWWGLRPLRVGLAAAATGGDFLVGEDVDLGSGLRTGGGRVRYSTVTAGPALRYWFSRSLRLQVDTGSTVYRRYEVFDPDNRQLLDSRFDDSWFVRTSLSFHVRHSSAGR